VTDHALQALIDSNRESQDPVPEDLLRAIYKIEFESQFLDADERSETQRAIRQLIDAAAGEVRT